MRSIAITVQQYVQYYPILDFICSEQSVIVGVKPWKPWQGQTKFDKDVIGGSQSPNIKARNPRLRMRTKEQW